MDKSLTEYLQQFFGFDRFKGQQEEAVKSLMDGKNTFVLMPTGGGKSLIYQLPALLLDGTAIVISPLIALMKNQVDSMRGMHAEDYVAHFLNSSLSKSAIQEVKNDVMAGKTKLLYVAPESLTKEDNIEFLKNINISFYAIDEAHCISEWGHDFRPEYRRIRPIVEEIGSAPIVALTATATAKVQHDIQKNLGILDAQVFKASFNRPNLYYEIRPKIKPEAQIIRFIKQNEGKSGIIYCLSRKKVEELGLDKNTVIVLWGDHGWHLGEYGIWGKYTNFDRALNSPLIIKTPEISLPGTPSKSIVETVDLFPTFADLCGLPLPRYLEGKSIKPIIEDPEAKISEYSIGERNAWGVHGFTIRSEQYRLMIWKDNTTGDTLEINLFDNNEQPMPYTDIADEKPKIVKQLISVLNKKDY